MIDKILEQRSNNYGSFHTQANLSQTLKHITTTHYNSTHTEALPDFMAEALSMILHKIARIVNGNPYYDDSWQDIAGYSQLVVGILEEAKQKVKQKEETTSYNNTVSFTPKGE